MTSKLIDRTHIGSSVHIYNLFQHSQYLCSIIQEANSSQTTFVISSYNKAATPNNPAPTAPNPTTNWFAAPVGLALADVAALAALAAEDTAVMDAEAREETSSELKEALTLEALEAAAEETELAVAPAPLVPVAVALPVEAAVAPL
ncbi:hypothetical protein H2200_009136 [Cladophialophora chaetospira]|uniref:Uncharacterized protein n=1 Tax=Cladophialophora chaetospira TaxID=386627 RepID=A0AA39CFF1_9EURO|nr:hypothetical protein H2200_009136 [Cladophialophora chaetospira]